VNLVAHGFYTAPGGALHRDQPVAFTSTFAHDCPCVFAMPVCKANAHVSSAARARACFRELWSLTPDERPELVPLVSGEYLRKRMNASDVKLSFMARVCCSTHALIT
jgi:hypothetical protein